MTSEKPEVSEAVLQARAKAMRLASAFKEVFGWSTKRTSSQRAVLEHLATCAGDDSNSYRFNDAMDGVSRIAAGIHRDGARSLLRIIDRQLEIASKPAEAPKPKPTVKR